MTDKHRMTDEQLGKELESLIRGNVESVAPPAGTFLSIQDRLGSQDADWSLSRLTGWIAPGNWGLPMFTGVFVKVAAVILVAVAIVAVLVFQGRDTDQGGIVPAADPTATVEPQLEITPTDEPTAPNVSVPAPPTNDAPAERPSPTQTIVPTSQPIATERPSASQTSTPNNISSPTVSPAPELGSWTLADGMRRPRYDHLAVALRDDRVLVLGGRDDEGFITETEIFDSSDGSWIEAGSLSKARDYGSSAILLSDGRVLVTGDITNSANPSSVSELYDPSTNTWSVLDTDPLRHSFGYAVALPDGSALVGGGMFESESVAKLQPNQIIDPNANTLTSVGALTLRREMSSVSIDPPIIVGGNSLSNSKAAELFDWESGEFVEIAPMQSSRGAAATVSLPDGTVMAVGGLTGGFSPKADLTTEIYDIENDSWRPGPNLATTSCMADIRALANGTVVVAGVGWGLFCSMDPDANAQVLLPGAVEWKDLDPALGLSSSGTVILSDGTIVITGGRVDFATLNDVGTLVLRPEDF